MKKLFCLGAGALMLCACSEMSNPQVSNSEAAEGSRSINVISSTTISDPAQDPYTVENMSKALRKAALAKSLTAQDSAEVEALDLEPNFLHVRFLCKGKEGVAALKANDPSLVLFKHPLDYKPVDKSIVYKDSSLPEGVIPMFATVPVDYNFGSTEYDVVKELFLVEPLDQDDDEDGRALLKRANGLTKMTSNKMIDLGVSLNEVEWTSLEMTGNLETRLGSNKDEIGDRSKLGWSLGGGGKRLGGELKYDADGKTLALEGVRVTGGYSYYWREAHTDANGKFTIPEKWNFSIDFEANFDNEKFLLEDGHSAYGEDLEIEKNNTYSDWKTTFTGNHAKWCQVWTAAYKHYYPNYVIRNKPREGAEISVYYKNSGNFDHTYDGLYDFTATYLGPICKKYLDEKKIKCLESEEMYSITKESLHQRVKDKTAASITKTTEGLIDFYTFIGNSLDSHKRMSAKTYHSLDIDALRKYYAYETR